MVSVWRYGVGRLGLKGIYGVIMVGAPGVDGSEI